PRARHQHPRTRGAARVGRYRACDRQTEIPPWSLKPDCQAARARSVEIGKAEFPSKIPFTTRHQSWVGSCRSGRRRHHTTLRNHQGISTKKQDRPEHAFKSVMWLATKH